MNGIEVVSLLTFLEQTTGRIKLDVLTASDLVFADGFVQAVARGSMHRALSSLVSLSVLLLALPVMGVTALAVWIE